MKRMVAFTESSSNQSYVEPSPYAWLRTRAPVPTTYAPACDPLYPFQEILENRTSRARGMTDNCAEVPSRKCLICIEIWQVELEDGVWRVSFHKYAYVHGDPIQGTDPTGMFLASSIGVVYNNIVLSVGDQMATDLFGLEVGLDPSTMLLSKMLAILGVAVQWVGSQLSRGLPVIEAGMFLESDTGGVSPTIAEDDAVKYASSAAFLQEEQQSSSNTTGAIAAARFGGLPSTSGAVSNFFKTGARLARYPVNLIAMTGKRKVYVGSHSQLGKFNKNFGIDSSIWQKHHLSQAAAFGPLGIPYGQGLSVNLRGGVTAGLQHADFHKLMDGWWAKFRNGGSIPTVADYNRQLEKVLRKVGFSGDEASEMVKLAERQQAGYNIFPTTVFKAIPAPTPS